MDREEVQNAINRHHFLVSLLEKINKRTDDALTNDKRWFAFGPKVCAKFLSQSKTLILLLTDKFLEFEDGQSEKYEDISTVFSIIRMQFETHALFYHLFVPCGNWDENLLRFRLWELDGIRHRIRMSNDTFSDHINYEKIIEETIQGIPYYKELNQKNQELLIKNAYWRFTSQSITEKLHIPISYDQLIKNTQIKKSIFSDLYARFSAYTHPTYSGVVDNYWLADEDVFKEKLRAIFYASFVTAFFIEDMAKRFVQGKEELNTLSHLELETYKSMILHGRYD